MTLHASEHSELLNFGNKELSGIQDSSKSAKNWELKSGLTLKVDKTPDKLTQSSNTFWLYFKIRDKLYCFCGFIPANHNKCDGEAI